MSDFNAQWHAEHKMPVRPSDQQRIDWHLEHARWCGCRPIPASVELLIAARDLEAAGALAAQAAAEPVPAAS